MSRMIISVNHIQPVLLEKTKRQPASSMMALMMITADGMVKISSASGEFCPFRFSLIIMITR